MTLYGIFIGFPKGWNTINRKWVGRISMKRLFLVGLLLSFFSVPAISAESNDEVFSRMDREKDGQLTLDEFLKSDISVSKGENDDFLISSVGVAGKDVDAATTEKHKRALFERLDVDNNGAVNRKEWMDSLSTGMVIFRY
jgi:Ca2+-binding EF-hand superfamily protein